MEALEEEEAEHTANQSLNRWHSDLVYIELFLHTDTHQVRVPKKFRHPFPCGNEQSGW